MDENRLSGTAKNIGGKLEEGIGQVTGDTKTQAEGIARQVSGAAQSYRRILVTEGVRRQRLELGI